MLKTLNIMNLSTDYSARAKNKKFLSRFFSHHSGEFFYVSTTDILLSV